MNQTQCTFLKENCGVVLMGIGCIIVIGIIRFSDWRPFGVCVKADSVNYTFETLSFSILAAIIFWLVNDYLKYRKRRVIAKRHINRQIKIIKELVRQMIGAVEPFNVWAKYDTLESFLMIFNEKDLEDGFYGGSRKIVEVYTEYKLNIEKIAANLLVSYCDFMTTDELETFDKILSSFLICNSIVPIEFSIPKEDRLFYPSNQNEVGKSIYELHTMNWPK